VWLNEEAGSDPRIPYSHWSVLGSGNGIWSSEAALEMQGFLIPALPDNPQISRVVCFFCGGQEEGTNQKGASHPLTLQDPLTANGLMLRWWTSHAGLSASNGVEFAS
jgi:hypothetical protein